MSSLSWYPQKEHKTAKQMFDSNFIQIKSNFQRTLGTDFAAHCRLDHLESQWVSSLRLSTM